jgi:hypothetical protein
MTYYIDTEFLEGTQKESFPISLFRKNTPPTIDLISIGIVAEDGREFYAISKDFNLKEAWNRYDEPKLGQDKSKYPNGTILKNYWIRENVLRPIFDELLSKSMQDKGSFVRDNFFTAYSGFTYGHLKALINYYGKTNKQIADEIVKFTCNVEVIHPINDYGKTPIKFYAYYADYDWVAFCWLFGKMMDLPNGFQMYCNDLKQELERMNESLGYNCDEKNNSYLIQEKPNYPKQENEHSAIHDARWNKKLHEFLNNL